MASRPAAQTMLKPTFAKVAASRYVPTNTNPNTSPNTTNSSDLAPQNAAHPGPTTAGGAVKAVSEQQSGALEVPPIIISKRAEEESAAGSLLPQLLANSIGDSPSVEMPAKPGAMDDNSTQVSSSGSFAKMVSFDKQSIASGATFGMDEEESLRPDDSASIRVIEEEDGCGTGATGSRVGSDTDARAFSEQLHKIAGMQPKRGILQPNKVRIPGIVFGEMTMDANSQDPLMIPNQVAPAISPPDLPIPDDKLLEALASQRDRVYVLKIEQDFIDFLKNEKDVQLVLPETNAFYRLLAHKLADYYRLDHEVTSSSTGSAVVITKSTYFRFPPPLSGLSQPSTTASTPPPTMPARQIMRRGGEGKEAGGDGNSDGTGTPGGSKNKTALTREEREKQYAEVRLRIFGNNDPDAADANKDAGEFSRSSSASGKQKSKNKSRRQNSDSDDDFKPRSQYPGYYPPQQPQAYPAAGSQYDGPVFYPQYGGMVGSPPGYPMQQQNTSPPMMYGPGFSPIDQPGQFAYPQPQQYQGSSPNGMHMPGYGQPTPGSYDMSAHFQQGMQSFQNSMPSTKLSSPSYTPPFQYQSQQAWPSGSQYDGGYQYPQQGFPPTFTPQRPMSTQSQPPTQPSYQHGQDPSHGFQNGNRTPRTQHPAPGSYMRPQFNPQTQAFVPGCGQGGQQHMIPGMNDVNVYRSMQVPTFNPALRGSGPMPGTLPHSTPSTSNASAYNSPRNHHAVPMGMPSYSCGSAPQALNNNGGQSYQQLAHPLPQPPTNPAITDEGIAKWGTPAHLPAKPPPPQNELPHKFIEINRGLPHHVAIPGLHRNTFTGENGTQ
ncbi:hypothetical protein BLS_001205 [Venturia inaequalis]|uniref:R3H domain-containing protein n=1 Tax=Venturia inaequalis TaxID=5025 RepID=A0A8H3VKI9_VENIN|nr:hypothetical protein BLS_001205 [Venturia inaequalis]KAE9989670.1 hypothetical protein EG327_002391 [Venturia inaequalis]RDI85171.1 hypothetical protein Vi05172_g4663 [Venturia inaequalis]